MPKISPQYKTLTDNSILIEFEQVISPQVLEVVTAMDQLIREADLYGVIETVPAYASLAVFYDPLHWEHEALIVELKKRLPGLKKSKLPESRLWEVSVSYEAKDSPDMPMVMKHSGLSREEVIRVHTQNEYLVYMLGFLPGFIYLGGMDERLNTPRKPVPDLKTAPGAVAIGGAQTGIYAIESPAGWNIIGHTRDVFFDPKSETPLRIKQGDRVRFVAERPKY